MADKVSFDLVAPERLLASEDVDMVVVPGAEGDFAVLPGHAPMVSTLRPGSLEVYEGDQPKDRYFVAGGFAEVVADRLTILAEEAIPLAELDRSVLEQRIQDAEEDAADANSDEERDRHQERVDHLRDILTAL